MPELKKLIWEGLSQLFPDHVCTSIQHGYSYLFFKGFKIIYNVDNSIDVLDVHIKTDYYIDKYGIDNVVEFTRDKARLIGDEEHHNTLAKMTLHSSSSTYGSNRDSLLNNIVLDIKYDIRNIEKYIASNDSALISITNYFYANNKIMENLVLKKMV